MMIDIDWNVFRAQNKNYRGSFEDLCYHLFCRENKVAEGIRADFNHTGLETDPISVGRKKIGFQSKFFDSSIDYEQVEHSVEKALKVYKGKLNSIWVYLNLSPSASAKGRKRIEKLAKKSKVTINWIVPSNFKILLNSPSNYDLAEFYFGKGDVLGFIRNSTRHSFQTLIRSKQFVELKVTLKSKSVANLKASLLKSRNKVALIVGTPGSGKSILVHKVFSDLAGLDTKSERLMLGTLNTVNSIPIIVDLKNCSSASLESILLGRKNECEVKGRSYNFVYLLDGLDELKEDIADHTLSFINELAVRSNTQKILISCRTGNSNRFRVKTYFNDLQEFHIEAINEKVLTTYFKARGDNDKAKKLKSLISSNPALVKEVRDVLFLKLLWETIDKLSPDSTLLDLLELKVSHLLGSSTHRKQLGSLNLPNPKEQEIVRINQIVSAEFQKTFQFRFSLKELQKLLLSLYPRNDYSSINEIVSYLASLFFDHYGDGSDNSPTSYIYQHRRYQEFFYVQHLAKAFNEHPISLRRSGILTSKDLFNNLFLNHLRRRYERDQDVIGVIGLNLIDTYLGNHKGYGADEAYYLNSTVFIKALAAQSDSIFMELISDPQAEIKEKVEIDLQTLEDNLKVWTADKKSYDAEQYLTGVWQEGVAESISFARLFFQNGKAGPARAIRSNLRKAQELFDKYKFVEHFKDHHRLEDPYWKRFEDWSYLRLQMDGVSPTDYLQKTVRRNYESFSSERQLPREPSGKERLLGGLFKVCIPNQDLLKQIIDQLDDYELQILLGQATTLDFLPYVLTDSVLITKSKQFLTRNPALDLQYKLELLFLKSFYGLVLSAEEKAFVEKQNEDLKNTRKIDWRYQKIGFSYGLTCFILKMCSFDQLNGEKHHKYYIDHLAYAALLQSYIAIICQSDSLESVLWNYETYLETTDDRMQNYLKSEISTLFAYVVARGFSSSEQIQLIRKIIFNPERDISAPVCLFNIRIQSPESFRQLVNKSDLQKLEKDLENWKGDFPSFVDRCFEISLMYIGRDEFKAKQLLQRGIFEGIVRHNWRKDVIVSYHLSSAFEILLSQNYINLESIEEYADKIFSLAVRVSEITDGKSTWQGPYNVIDVVAAFDVALAEKLKKKLDEAEGRETSNRAVTTILLAKVALGVPLSDIEEGFENYRSRYDFEGKPQSEVFEEKFKVFLSVATSTVYRQKDKEAAFEKAYEIVEKFNELKISYGFRDDYYRNEKLIFKDLCSRYKKDFNLTFDKKDEEKTRPSKYSEKEFVTQFKAAKTKRQIKELFGALEKYENHIILPSKESWDAIVDNTFRIFSNVRPFLNYLKQQNFPHTDWYASNSKYLHFGLAAAMRNPKLKIEVFDYLKRSTGHGGFLNMIRCYSVNQDEEMCMKLFDKYIQYCELLVN